MPNWCIGDMKLRGRASDICKFLEDNLVTVVSFGEEAKRAVENDLENGYFSASCDNGFRLKGFQRHLVDTNCIEFCFEHLEDGEDKEFFNKHATFSIGLEIAWGVLPAKDQTFGEIKGGITRWIEVSKKYDLDLKFYGFEAGNQFNQSIEIRKGELIEFKDITFEDYQWECVLPSLGG